MFSNFRTSPRSESKQRCPCYHLLSSPVIQPSRNASLMKDPDFLRRLDIPSNSLTFLKAAQDSTSSLSTAAVKQTAKSYLKKSHSEAWTASLDPLEVQSKFKDIISLKPQSHTCFWLDYRQASCPFYSELDLTVCPLR